MVKVPENNPFVTGERETIVSNTQSAKDLIHEFLKETDFQNRYLIIVFSYVLFVKWIGPYYMKNRKPYNLKTVMIIYNFTNASLSAAFAWLDFRPKAWMWLLHKHFDLLDTVFFVLRRKNNHVSNLHVIHHVGLVCLGVYLLKYNVYSFYMLLMVCINSLIHVIMYIYYGLAAFGPHMQKYLWWKEYMTQLQIAQFIILLLYMAHAFATGCEVMDTLELSTFAFILLVLILFLNFYIKRYKQHQN